MALLLLITKTVASHHQPPRGGACWDAIALVEKKGAVMDCAATFRRNPPSGAMSTQPEWSSAY